MSNTSSAIAQSSLSWGAPHVDWPDWVLDWPVQPQKILYLAYLDWRLLHFSFPPHSNNFFLLFNTFLYSSRSHLLPRSIKGRVEAIRCRTTSCATTPEQTDYCVHPPGMPWDRSGP